jgi:hypothetical protein
MATAQLSNIYKRIQPNGPLPSAEKQWEVCLSSKEEMYFGNALALAQPLLEKDKATVAMFIKFLSSTNDQVAINAIKGLTNGAREQIIAEELKRVGVAGPVAVLKRVKTSPEKTSVLKFAVNSIHNEPTLLLWLKAGAIPCFLNSLQSKDFEENNTALLAVNNIVSISPASNYPLFATRETYLAFASLLDSSVTDEDALHIIIRIQSNLTSDEKNRQMFKDAGCVPKAVKLIKEINTFGNPKLKESLLGLVSNIIKHGEIAAEIVKSGAFKSILDSLSDPNEDVKSACLAAITNFSANEESVTRSGDAISNSPLFKQLTQLLKTNTQNKKLLLRAVLTVSNLMVHESIQEQFKEVGGIGAIVNIINSNVPDDVKLKAVTATFHMSMYYDSMRSAIVQTGGLKALTTMLSGPQTQLDVKLEACKSMVNLSLADDNETDFINEKAIKPLIDILTKESNADAQTLASMTLENLSTNPQVSEHIREVGGVKAALTMFKSSGNDKIQERAAKLLSKLAVNSKSRQEFQTLGGVAVLKGYQARDKGLKDAIALAVNNMSVPHFDNQAQAPVQEDFAAELAALKEMDTEDDIEEYDEEKEKHRIRTQATTPRVQSSAPKNNNINAFPRTISSPKQAAPAPAPGLKKSVGQVPPGPPKTRPTRSLSSPRLSKPPGVIPKMAPKGPVKGPPSNINTAAPNQGAASPRIQSPVPPPRRPSTNAIPNNNVQSPKPTETPNSPPQMPSRDPPKFFHRKNSLDSLTAPIKPKDIEVANQYYMEIEEELQEENIGLKREQYTLGEDHVANNKRKSNKFSDFLKRIKTKMFKSKSEIAIKPSGDEINEKPKNPCATVLWDYFDQWCEACKQSGDCVKTVDELRRQRVSLIRDRTSKSFKNKGRSMSLSIPRSNGVRSANSSPAGSPRREIKSKPLPMPKPAHLKSKPLPVPPKKSLSEVDMSSTWSPPGSPKSPTSPIASPPMSPKQSSGVRQFAMMRGSKPPPPSGATTPHQTMLMNSTAVNSHLPQNSTSSVGSAANRNTMSPPTTTRSTISSMNTMMTSMSSVSSNPSTVSSPSTVNSNTNTSNTSTISTMNSTTSVTPTSPKQPPKQVDTSQLDEKKMEQAKKHFKRTKIAQELLVTEGTYVKNLSIIVKKFQNPLLNSLKSSKPLVAENDIRVIFGSVEIIWSYNSMLLEGLNSRLIKWSSKQCIGDIFLFMGEFLKTYTEYINNYRNSQIALLKCRTENPRLAKFLEKVTTTDQILCGMDLESYLIMPVQRVPRYQLLLQQLMDNTSADHPDYDNLKNALAKIAQINAYLNERRREFEDRTKLIIAANDIVGEVDKIFLPHRTLIADADIQFYDDMLSKHVPGKLYLLNDALMYSKTVKYKKEMKQKVQQLILLKNLHTLSVEGELAATLLADRGDVIKFEFVGKEPKDMFMREYDKALAQSKK